jgi:hypothetical protein
MIVAHILLLRLVNFLPIAVLSPFPRRQLGSTMFYLQTHTQVPASHPE